MRATALNTICTMTLTAILFVGVSAAAQDSNMEATAGCVEDVECMFRGQPALAQNDGVARLQRINIFSSNGRDPRTSQERAFSPVAVIETNSPVPVGNGEAEKGQGTAFMISPCLALTNRHAVFGADQNPAADRDRTVTISIGANQDGTVRQIKGTAVRWGRGTSDWAVVQLEQCAGRRVGWLAIDAVSGADLENTQVGMAGFPADRANAQVSVQSQCSIRGFNYGTGEIHHDCAGRPGASGSPIYAMKDGRPVVVAIHAGTVEDAEGVLRSYSVDKANVGIPVQDMFETNPEIRSFIDKDIQSFGQPNPANGRAAAPRTNVQAA